MDQGDKMRRHADSPGHGHITRPMILVCHARGQGHNSRPVLWPDSGPGVQLLVLSVEGGRKLDCHSSTPYTSAYPTVIGGGRGKPPPATAGQRHDASGSHRGERFSGEHTKGRVGHLSYPALVGRVCLVCPRCVEASRVGYFKVCPELFFAFELLQEAQALLMCIL